jgi:dihydroxy-acid dehydratase
MAAGVNLTIDDFTRIGKNVPVVADLKPSGKYMMSELVEIGGTLPLMKMLLEAGLLHGDCMTVTGQTMVQNLENVKPYVDSQEIIRALDNPIKKDSHLRILRGNLAVDGALPPKPLPMTAEVGASISRIPGPPAGPS